MSMNCTAAYCCDNAEVNFENKKLHFVVLRKYESVTRSTKTVEQGAPESMTKHFRKHPITESKLRPSAIPYTTSIMPRSVPNHPWNESPRKYEPRDP